MRIFFDTNILVYVFDNDSPEKQAIARERLRSAVVDGSLVLSTQVLQEFHVAVTRKLEDPVTPEVSEEILQNLSRLPILSVDPPLVLAAARLSRVHTISFWDALIVESAIAAGAATLLTEDLQAGRVFGQLRVENPFPVT